MQAFLQGRDLDCFAERLSGPQGLAPKRASSWTSWSGKQGTGAMGDAPRAPLLGPSALV